MRTENGPPEVAAATPIREGYRADIDGLRGIAVLSVLFFHAGVGFLSGGFTGVDIFFVISGYLIGGHIYGEEKNGRFSWSSFYWRRVKRILPALYSVIVFVLLIGIILLAPLDLRRLGVDAGTTLLSCSNIYFWHTQDYFAAQSELRPLLMTWSLGIEEQFYIIVPFIMIWAIRKRISLQMLLGALTTLSFAIAYWQVQHLPKTAFYLLPSRAWELLAGVMLAIFVHGKALADGRNTGKIIANVVSIIGFALVASPLFFLKISIPFPGFSALPTVIGTVLLLAIRDSWIHRAILSPGPFRYVGRISYSLYLWHWPILSFASIVLGRKPSVRASLALLAIAFLLSIASYNLIEQPFRKTQMERLPTFVRYGAVTALLMVLCGTFFLSHGFRFMKPGLAAMEKKDILSETNSCLVTDGDITAKPDSLCQEQQRQSAVALWGDSHAFMVGATIRDVAHQTGFDLLQFEKTACPPLLHAGLFFHATPEHPVECNEFGVNALKQIKADPRIHTVILQASWQLIFVGPLSTNDGWLVLSGDNPTQMPDSSTSVQRFHSSLLETVTELQHAGKKVILMEDGPSFYTSPLWRFVTSHIAVRRWIMQAVDPSNSADPGFDGSQHQNADNQARSVIEQVSKQTGAPIYDLRAGLCSDQNHCRYRDDKDLFFRDFNHFTDAGARAALSGFSLQP
jgi:peptidoglycan/LPS O-acetylase OafA/YrhL